MKDGAPRGGVILVDDGKSRRVDGIRDTHSFAQGFDEGSLPGSHCAIEGKDSTISYLGDKLLRSISYAVY